MSSKFESCLIKAAAMAFSRLPLLMLNGQANQIWTVSGDHVLQVPRYTRSLRSAYDPSTSLLLIIMDAYRD